LTGDRFLARLRGLQLAPDRPLLVLLRDFRSSKELPVLKKLGRTTHTTSDGLPADLRADRRPRSPPVMARCRSARISAARLRVPAFHCGIYAHNPSFGLVPRRGHTLPPFPPIGFEQDMAVVGPMARSAADLSLLLDVMAGPDPLEAGVAYKLALPPSRHDALKDFRVLVVDTHPILSPNREVRESIEKLVGNLEKARATVARQSSLLPDFVESSRLYMRMVLAVFASYWPVEEYERQRAGAAQLKTDDRSLVAERLRGVATSYRAWVSDRSARAGLRA
jgi:amidase